MPLPRKGAYKVQKDKIVFLTYRSPSRAILAGPLTSPQTRALTIKGSTVDGNTTDSVKYEPVRGVSEDTVIGGGHKSAIDTKGDVAVLAWPAKHSLAEQVSSRRHVDRGRMIRAAN